MDFKRVSESEWPNLKNINLCTNCCEIVNVTINADDLYYLTQSKWASVISVNLGILSRIISSQLTQQLRM